MWGGGLRGNSDRRLDARASAEERQDDETEGERAVDQAVERVCHRLRMLGEREVPSRTVGETVMEELRHLDEVAYVRFASVYRSFQDVEAFRDAIEHLRHQRRRHDADRSQLPLLPGETPPGKKGR